MRMASRHRYAPTNDQQIEFELQVPRSGTYFIKPTASCGAAQLWVRATPPPHIVPRRGTDASRMMFRMIVGPASRNQGMVMSAYPTAALLRSLQWVSDGYVFHRDTALIGVSAMGGCVATAGRHSLLSLPRQLVNCNELQVPRSGTYIMKPTASCGAAQLWVHATPPPKYSSPKGD